ncbi:DUF1659 domain-containing protein [Bacillus testis]|uniref:DUF1659 domain-containing protein n=1 Tax=Bacillus testis TaxID=1622072 RepID=UPI00067E7E83|nr:DUF1659 domain-containing protein [Bacillus testis]
MATETLLSKQLRLCLQSGIDTQGNPVVKRKSFSNIEGNATVAQLVATAQAIAELQTLPLLSIEQQEIQNLEN